MRDGKTKIPASVEIINFEHEGISLTTLSRSVKPMPQSISSVSVGTLVHGPEARLEGRGTYPGRVEDAWGLWYSPTSHCERLGSHLENTPSVIRAEIYYKE